MDAYSDPQYKTADGAALRMWRDDGPNNFLSELHGRPLFDEVIYCEVITPGSKDSTPVFELVRKFCLEANIAQPRYGPKYKEYKTFVEDFEKNAESDGSMAGTPLSQWPEMKRGMVAALKAAGIFTVDALAALPDGKLTVVGPDGRTWREKAKAYIENAKGGAYATALASRVETLETERQAGADREKALATRIQELEAAAATGAKPQVVAPAAPPVVAEPPSAPMPII